MLQELQHRLCKVSEIHDTEVFLWLVTSASSPNKSVRLTPFKVFPCPVLCKFFR